jgi:superfamily II DNA or RNA helicase
MVDTRRRFTLAQKIDLYVSAAGLCRGCRNLLQKGWHGHHKEPHSHGGATIIDNGDALCPECHKREHRRMSLEDEIGKFGAFRKDYSWQDESVETFIRSINVFYSKQPGQFQRAYLNEVSPSGGKTVFSMKLARRMISDGLVDRVVWCVPRDSIKIGFADDTRRVVMPEEHRLVRSQYIRIDTDLDANYAGQLRNYHGLALTYQALPKRLEYLGLLAAKYRLMFIFDEVHHGATGEADEAMNEWARAMDACRAIAHAVVCMTGTPLRSDSKQVVFVDYDQVSGSDGRRGYQVRPDFSFSYSKAVTAGVARKIICRSQDPDITYDAENDEGDIERHCKPVSAIPSDHLRKVKNTAFCFTRGIIDDLLKIAHDECDRLRATGDPDAGILVIGRRDVGDINSLKQIQSRIRDLFGDTAVTVESADGPTARDAIRKFKYGTERWIVAKEMISEGTNLPRLRIVVILRDIGNRTFYEQLVHRATRNDADDRPQDAIIVQLKLRHLHEWGTDLERQALIGWERRKQQRKNDGAGAGDAVDRRYIEGIAAELENESVVMEGEDFTDVDPTGRKLQSMVGNEIKSSRWQINKILRGLGKLGVSFSGISAAPAQDELLSIEEEFKRRRERANAAIRKAGVNLGGGDETFKRLNAECKKAAGIRGRLDDVIRDNPKPIDAIKAFEQAAYRALQRSSRQGDLPL